MKKSVLKSITVLFILTFFACGDSSSNANDSGETNNEFADVFSSSSYAKNLDDDFSDSSTVYTCKDGSLVSEKSKCKASVDSNGNIVFEVSDSLKNPLLLSSSSVTENETDLSQETFAVETDDSDIPYLKITTDELVDSVYVEARFVLKGNGKYENYTGSGKIRQRGNSTRKYYDKKPYRIKLSEKAEILGLAANKDWVLLANYRALLTL